MFAPTHIPCWLGVCSPVSPQVMVRFVETMLWSVSALHIGAEWSCELNLSKGGIAVGEKSHLRCGKSMVLPAFALFHF